jgi:hypothetical protein
MLAARKSFCAFAASHGKAKSDMLDQYGIDEEFVLIIAPGQGSKAYTSLIIPLSRITSAGIPTNARLVLSWENWGK